MFKPATDGKIVSIIKIKIIIISTGCARTGAEIVIRAI
jgi:hypothetical protein